MTSRPFIVGVTGGICSRKSAVTARFAERGIPVLDADIVARELVAPGEPALADIVQVSGQQMLDAIDRLDRAPHEDIFIAAGHGHLGLTQAAITGQLVGPLAMGEATE